MPQIYIYNKAVNFDPRQIIEQFNIIIPLLHSSAMYTIPIRYTDVNYSNIREEIAIFGAQLEEFNKLTAQDSNTINAMIKNTFAKLAYIEFVPDLTTHMLIRQELAIALSRVGRNLEAMEQHKKILDLMIKMYPDKHQLMEVQAKKILDYYIKSLADQDTHQAMITYQQEILQELRSTDEPRKKLFLKHC